MTNFSIKIFSYFKKNPLSILLPLFVLGILFFPYQAKAAWLWDTLAGVIIGIPNALVLALLYIFVLISGVISVAMGGLLNFVLSPDFISYSYTKPGIPTLADPTLNPIIEAGLSVTQGFVNIALVLILVYIALMTILRMSDVKTSKLLFSVVIVALLVNFAPVIIGIVVDISNVLMHYFTEKLTGFSGFSSRMAALNESIKGTLGGQAFQITTQLSLISQVAIILVLNCILLMVFGAYSLIFIMRYIAIWMIVILSPLAFVAYILPQTQGFFKQWRDQLIQWCFIGVTGGFFLYLSERVSEVLMGGKETADGVVPFINYTSQQGIFDKILPNIVVVVFVVMGLVLSLKSGATASDVILKAAKRGSEAAGKSFYKGGLGGVKKIYSNYGKAINHNPITDSRLLKPSMDSLRKGVGNLRGVGGGLRRWSTSPEPERINQYGGVGNQPYGPPVPPKGINQYGGVSNQPYGPPVPPVPVGGGPIPPGGTPPTPAPIPRMPSRLRTGSENIAKGITRGGFHISDEVVKGVRAGWQAALKGKPTAPHIIKKIEEDPADPNKKIETYWCSQCNKSLKDEKVKSCDKNNGGCGSKF